MKKIIPEKHVVVCDLCDAICSGENYKMQTCLTMAKDALDFLGDPVCDGTRKWDLCDECTNKVSDAIQRLEKA